MASTISKLSTNTNERTKQIAEKINAGLKTISNKKVTVDGTTYTVNGNIMALGVGVAFIDVSWKDSKNKNQKVSLGWTNVGTKSGINALASFCTALSDLNKELWKEFASYALTGSKKGKKILDCAEKIITAICNKDYANSLIQDMGSTVASKLKSTITNKFRQFIKDNVAGGDVIVTAADQLKTLETKQTELTTAIDSNTNVISKLKDFTTACNKLEKTLDLSESTFTIDTPTGLSYNEKFTSITISSSYGKKLNSADYDSNVTSINASSRTTAITIEGNSKGNTINGSKGADTIYGNAGNDNISGGNGNDTLFGGVGNDKLYGQNGNDSLIGGAGNDNLTGGAGKDIFYYKDGDGNDTITDYKAGEDKIQIASGTITALMSGKKAIFKVGKGKITVNNGKDKNITIIDSNGKEVTYINGKIVDSDTPTTPTKPINGDSVNSNGITVTLGTDASGTFKLDEWNNDKSESNKAININAQNCKNGLTIYADDRANIIWSGGDSSWDSQYIYAGKGNDVIHCGNGRDYIYYYKGDGNETIYNLNDDYIELKDCTIKDFSVSSSDITINLNDGSTITLKDSFNKNMHITGQNTLSFASYVVQNNKFVIDKNGSGHITLVEHSLNSEKYIKDIDASACQNSLGIYADDRVNEIWSGGDSSWDSQYIYAGKGNDVIHCGNGRDYIHYYKGDGNETIYNLNDDYIELHDCSVSNVSTNNSAIILNLDTGNTIILKDSFNKNIHITGLGTVSYAGTTGNNFEERNDVEEHWFTADDDNFTNSEVSSILNSDNLISNDCELESELQFHQQFIKDTALTSITYNQTKKN